MPIEYMLAIYYNNTCKAEGNLLRKEVRKWLRV
nr:MAG TPA: hypothetical protein [Bacteriophage sp.]